MARVFWDTNLFIYLLEENPLHVEEVRELWISMRRRGDRLLTSQLACAAQVQTDLFITHDDGFRGKGVEGIGIITSLARNPL